jgi:hypothetical protein
VSNGVERLAQWEGVCFLLIKHGNGYRSMAVMQAVPAGGMGKPSPRLLRALLVYRSASSRFWRPSDCQILISPVAQFRLHVLAAFLLCHVMVLM